MNKPTLHHAITMRPFAALTIAVLLAAVFAGPFDAAAQTDQHAKAAPEATHAAAAVPLKPSDLKSISAKTLENRYGLRITLMAVTAGGGMVDFRFKVLDRGKARQVLADPDHPPTLLVEGSGLMLSAPHHMARNIRLQDNAVCYLLFPNARNAVKAGTPVSAVFGNFKVEPVRAQ